jgi:hypothetical protein
MAEIDHLRTPDHPEHLDPAELHRWPRVRRRSLERALHGRRRP